MHIGTTLFLCELVGDPVNNSPGFLKIADEQGWTYDSGTMWAYLRAISRLHTVAAILRLFQEL